MASQTKLVLRAAAVAAGLVIAAPVFGVLAQNDGHVDGRGPAMLRDRTMMGPGMMGHGMMSHGMMSGHMTGDRMGGHHGVTGHRFGHRLGQRVTPAVHLTEADVRHYFEHRLERRGNTRLKVGEVKQKDDDTVVADIVTRKEGALIDRFEVDRHTGLLSPVN